MLPGHLFCVFVFLLPSWLQVVINMDPKRGSFKSLNPEVKKASSYSSSTFTSKCVLKALFPALYSGHVYFPQVPVGIVNVRGRNNDMKRTDICVFWSFSDKRFQRFKSEAFTVEQFCSQRLQHQTESYSRGLKNNNLPNCQTCQIQTQLSAFLERKQTCPASLSPTCGTRICLSSHVLVWYVSYQFPYFLCILKMTSGWEKENNRSQLQALILFPNTVCLRLLLL